MKFLISLFLLLSFSTSYAQDNESVFCEFSYNYVNGQVGSEVRNCRGRGYVFDNIYGSSEKLEFKSESDANEFILKNKKIACFDRKNNELYEFDDRFRFYSCYTKSTFIDSNNQSK